MLKITGCDSYTDCVCLQIQPMISPWNLNLYKLDFLKSDTPIAWQCSTSKQDQPFPGGVHWSVRQLCHPLIHFPKPPFILLPTVGTAADLSSLSWRGCSSLPPTPCISALFPSSTTCNWSPIAGPEHLCTAPTLSPLYPMTGPLCYAPTIGRFLLQSPSSLYFAGVI